MRSNGDEGSGEIDGLMFTGEMVDNDGDMTSKRCKKPVDLSHLESLAFSLRKIEIEIDMFERKGLNAREIERV